MNYIKGIFKDRSEIQARILVFRLEDVVSLKLKNFFNERPEPWKRKMLQNRIKNNYIYDSV